MTPFGYHHYADVGVVLAQAPFSTREQQDLLLPALGLPVVSERRFRTTR